MLMLFKKSNKLWISSIRYKFSGNHHGHYTKHTKIATRVYSVLFYSECGSLFSDAVEIPSHCDDINYFILCSKHLTHLLLDKLAVFSQTVFSYAFS